MKVHRDSIVHLSYWYAAGSVGVLAVAYAKIIAWAQGIFFSLYSMHSNVFLLATPLLFLTATFLVVRFAPAASGSGIPQVLQAIEQTKDEPDERNPLISVHTAFVKIISSLVGIFAGASIGREGPTVQIASTTFAWVAGKTRRLVPQLDLHSYIIAGGAAGVAAAFNTPLAGIAFALEEIAESSFSKFKQSVMLAVVIAGITAQAIVGDYLYFGHPTVVTFHTLVLPESVLVGVAGGLLGSLFSKCLTDYGLSILPVRWVYRTLVCGVVCAILAFLTSGSSSGSGYEITRGFMDGGSQGLPILFFGYKFLATIFSYLSGMAGGIFSPCLAIGSGLGFTVGKLTAFPDLRLCALLGMVAFFSGVIQAPLTGVIIVMEMTDAHVLIIPFMIAAFVAQWISKFITPVPLYHFLAHRAHASGSH